MSWRSIISLQPTRASANATPRVKVALIFIAHLSDVLGIEALQEAGGLCQMELWIMRLDAQEKLVARGVLKALDVKQWVMRLRQSVKREHAEDCESGSAKHGQLESHRNERRPAVEGPAADVQRI